MDISDTNKQGILLMVGCDIPSCEMVSSTKFKLSLKARNKNTEILFISTEYSLLNFLGVEFGPCAGLPLVRKRQEDMTWTHLTRAASKPAHRKWPLQ